MSFAHWGYRAASACLLLAPVTTACGSDEGSPAGGGSDAAAGHGGGGAGGTAVQTGGAAGGGGVAGAGTGAQGGSAGAPAAGAGGAGDAGAACALACVHGACVTSGGTESCVCDSSYAGALCDDITTPPATAIALWLDAQDDATTGGGSPGPLRRWLDKSGAGLVALAGPGPVDAGADADAAGSGVDASVPPPPVDGGDAGDAAVDLGDDVPSLVVDASRGRRSVRFDGNDCMRLEGFGGLTDQDAYDVFLVVSATAGAQSILSGYAAAGHGLRVETTATSLRFLHRMPFGNSGGDSLVATQAFSRTELDLATMWRSATEHSLRRPGSDAESISVTAAAFDEDLTVAVGCLDAQSPSRYLVGELAEVLVYRGGLGDVDRAAVEDYLSRKWLGQSL